MEDELCSTSGVALSRGISNKDINDGGQPRDVTNKMASSRFETRGRNCSMECHLDVPEIGVVQIQSVDVFESTNNPGTTRNVSELCCFETVNVLAQE